MLLVETIASIMEKNKGTLNYLEVPLRQMLLVAIFEAILSKEVAMDQLYSKLWENGLGSGNAKIRDYIDSLVEHLTNKEIKDRTPVLKEISLFLFHETYEGADLGELLKLFAPKVVSEVATMEAQAYLTMYLRTDPRFRDHLSYMVMAIRLKCMALGRVFSESTVNDEITALQGGDEILLDTLSNLRLDKEPQQILFFPVELLARIDGRKEDLLKKYFSTPTSTNAEELIQWYKSRGFTPEGFRVAVEDFYQTAEIPEYIRLKLYSQYESYL